LHQCFVSGYIESGSRILGRIPIRIQGFDARKLGKIYSWEKNGNLPTLGSIKDFQATRKPWPFSPQKRHPALQNMKFLNF
jgi:hypothetical protein